MTTSISLKAELAEQIRSIAEKNHRSFSGQVAFFCEQGVRDLSKLGSTLEPVTTDKNEN